MEAMRIMGIPDEEQIGRSPLESLKCKKIEAEIEHISVDFYFYFVFIFWYFFVVTLFLWPQLKPKVSRVQVVSLVALE